jgi:hypothetical protein
MPDRSTQDPGTKRRNLGHPAISTNAASIRIDNPPSGRGIDKLGSLRVLLKACIDPGRDIVEQVAAKGRTSGEFHEEGEKV